MASTAKALRVTASLLRRWPLPQPPGDGDKEDRGRVLLIAGSPDVAGAAILAGNAALRAGAGKVCIATARAAVMWVAQSIPEARVIKWPLAKSELDDFDAIVLGPGMQESVPLSSNVRALLRKGRTPLVIDAGALPALGDAKSSDKSSNSAEPLCIVTPHAGEMARLTNLERRYVESRAPDIARDVARAKRVVVVLKGATTYIADPDGNLWIHDGGNVSLAASGSGDVLAGIMGGLAARGASCAQAAVWGVALHALAGERLVAQHGSLGALARELPHHVPALMEKLRPASRTTSRPSR